MTQRLARYVHDLCKLLTVKEVADHLGLDWKTVRRIDGRFLKQAFGETDCDGLRLMAVDEIAIRKGHNYMTVVLDFETGRVLWLGEGRKAETLQAFFDGMTPEQKEALQAVAMDMWEPYIKAVRESVPHVKIVFDLFHVVHAFNKVIDDVRVSEYKKASEKNKAVIRGSKYLLLTNDENLTAAKQRKHLKRLLRLNAAIATVMILKDMLKRLWSYVLRPWARRALDAWCALAEAVDHSEVRKFARRLRRYAYGILNHCQYPIHTSILEGVNNKIKLAKRKAYGYRDLDYFALKVIQAFDSN